MEEDRSEEAEVAEEEEGEEEQGQETSQPLKRLAGLGIRKRVGMRAGVARICTCIWALRACVYICIHACM